MPCFLFKISSIYSREKHTQTQRQRDRESQRHRQREKQAPCRESDVGLDPVSRITPWAKGRRSTAELLRDPRALYFPFKQASTLILF